MAEIARPSRARLLAVLGAGIAALAIGGTIWGVSVARPDAGAGPPSAALPDDAAMGAVELNVRDLDLVRDYYADAVGLEVLSDSATGAELGLSTPLIRLVPIDEGEAGSTPNEAGLYHSAILYPDEAALARTLMTLAETAPDSFQGSADHAVSQAFYFADPEGNGLELYVDRPEDEWVWDDGEVRMGSAELDPNSFIQAHLDGDDRSPAAAASMGHVHLRVGDLAAAEAFYADALGFAVTSRADGAVFYSAGGYHHHLATNVWQSPGAEERSNPVGLGALTLTLAEEDQLDALVARLDEAGLEHRAFGTGVATADPWGNELRVVLR
ncbi:VOC family protein [Leucobacter weissii]|uniref:VOC family protein n=1 Tax=Leucobacter weissii TaxID=1983706 RepID=A0A939MI40_9MICO|nr:VOC family protein [Leucobacter weissii]MBO1901353.1 VOC family protein [Leucobacter weissii]